MTISRRAVLAAAATAFLPRLSLAESVRLRFIWWGSSDRAERTNKALAVFQQKFPGITVAGEYAGWGDYWPRVATQVAGRNAPDLIQMDYRYIVEYARRGVLLPLDAYLGKGLSIEDFGADNIDSGRVDGKLFGINLGNNSSVLIAAVQPWQDAGLSPPPFEISWEGLAELGEKFARANKRRGLYALSDASGNEPIFENWLRQNGKPLYTDDGSLGFDAADLTRWFEMWQGMRKARSCAPADVQALDKMEVDSSLVTTGHAATGFAHSNQFVAFQRLNKNKLVMGRVPLVSGATLSGDYLKPSQQISLAATTVRPEVAVQLANFLVEDPDAVSILGVERAVPASSRARALVAETVSEADRVTVDFINKMEGKVGRLPPSAPKGAGEVAIMLNRVSQEVGFEQMTPRTAAERVVTEATAIIKRA
ncbi:MAG: ABC transporter substrate-binding protein [Pseudomonadota bacterium]|nr:ABC transporter substrate-binding protein [Pseudomonadota bacterium]